MGIHLSKGAITCIPGGGGSRLSSSVQCGTAEQPSRLNPSVHITNYSVALDTNTSVEYL